MRRLCLIFLIFNYNVWSFAQTNELDSLTQIVQESPNDSLRGAALIRLSNLLKNRQPDSARVLATQAYQIADEGQWNRLKATALLFMGTMQMKKGVFDVAQEEFGRAIQLFRLEGDSLGVADAMQSIGNIHRRQSEYTDALRYYFECARLREEFGASDWTIASSYTNIGNVYYFTKDYNKALENYIRVLNNFRKNKDQEGVVRIYNNIFGVLYAQEKYQEGIVYLKKALHLSDSMGLRVFKAANLTNLGEAYKSLKQYPEAYEYSARALELFQDIGDQARIGMVLKNMGILAQEMGDHQKAIDYFEQSLDLANKMNHRTNRQDAYENLAISYAATKQYDKAYTTQTAFNQIKDSLVNEASTAQLNEMKTRFETEQKEQAIAQMEEQHVSSQRERRWLLGGIAALALLILITLWAMWQRRKAYRHLQEEQEQTSQLLQEKEQMLEQLIQSEKLASIGQLTAGIAHEINNPINFVASNAQALKQDFEEIDALLKMITQLEQNPQQKDILHDIIQQSEKIDVQYLSDEINQLLNSIQHGTDRTINIVSSLRNFSRNTADQFQEADIHQGIDSALTILKNQISDRILIKRHYATDLPLIHCQINKLSQVFLNIINNAIQAIGESGELHIRTSQQQEFIEIRVKDNGQGMDEATRQQIFEPFFTTKEMGKGTGLGLSISHKIIKAHQGRIEVHSEEGQGTEFIIYLPLKQQKKAS